MTHRRRDSSPASRPHGGRSDGADGDVTSGAVGWGRAVALLAAVLLLPAAPGPASAQGGGAGGTSGPPGVEVGGLLVAGFRAEPPESDRSTAFELFHARLSASGTAGPGVEYLVRTGFDPADRDLSLLDARLTIPVVPELRVTAGQFKAPFSREALMGPAELQFAERAQGPAAVAPLRQVGVQLSGDVLDRRLRYRAGVFNGEGRTAQNPDALMLYAGRVEFSRLGGDVQFYDELNVTVGASAAVADESGRDVSDAGPFRPPLVAAGSFRGQRILLGGDLELSYRSVFLAGEYVRGAYDPEPLLDGSTGAPTQVAEGLAVEGGYRLWGGLVDLVGRLDTFDPPAAGRRDFLVLGANVYPGLDTRLGLQYAARLDEAAALPDDGLTSPAPSPLPGGLADGQFILRLQTGF